MRYILAVALLVTHQASAWVAFSRLPPSTPRFMSSNWGDGDSNAWQSSTDSASSNDDWQAMLEQKRDGSFWTTFESLDDEKNQDLGEQMPLTPEDTADMAAEAWLDTIAALSAEEVEFNRKEAERAETARQMQEWGFQADVIESTLGVSMNASLETVDELKGMEEFRQKSYLEEVDLQTVESHTQVEIDPDTGEPVRQQMVYVDEHTCIGCTNCAMIAQSTFYMNAEHGRARVFQQWGDDDETIQIAIETCPVDCIHYVPYDELVKLEKERRGQNINFKARLVSQAENGNSLSHAVGGPNAFTAPQQISGNMGARCNNCPSRGCRDCPMFGVGKNPEFERKEKARLERMAKRRLLQERESQQKSAEL